MIIVAGPLFVDPAEREAYLAGCVSVMEHARSVDGCFDFTLTADPLEPGRINVFERWESDEQLLRFRSGEAGAGTQTGPQPELRGADVAKYRISGVEAP